MSAPVSQISAAALPAGTEQLGLVAALPQRSDDARASGIRMSSVLLDDERQMLSDELGRWTCLAPLGYLNAPRAMRHSLIADPERAPSIRGGEGSFSESLACQRSSGLRK